MQQTRLKRIAIVAGAFVTAIIILLMSPPVQTRLLRAAVSGAGGARVEIERVWAGPWGADLRGLRVTAPWFELEVPHAEADVAFWSSLGHLGLDLETVTASDLRIAVGKLPERGETDTGSAEFGGLGRLARLPKRLVVRRVEADGSVDITLSEVLKVAGPWSASAADVGRDRRPKGSLQSTLSAVRGGEIVAAAEVTAGLDAVVDSDGVVTNATAEAGLHALGEQARGLDALVELQLAPDRESYRLTVDQPDGHRIVEATASFTPADRVVDGTWATSVSPELLAVFARGRTLPELAATTNGAVRFTPSQRRFEIECNGRVEGRGWSDFDPRLGEVDELVVDFDLAGASEAGRLEARRLHVAMTGAAGRELVRLRALQPVTIDLEAWRFVPENWGESALRIEADRFPLRWTRGFSPAVVVEGGTVSLALDIVPMSDRHSRLVTSEPIRVAGLRLKGAAGGPPAPPLEITIVPQLELDNGALEASIERAQLTAPGGFDLRFSGVASTSPPRWPVVSLAGDLSVSAPRLQRLIDSLHMVRGEARFDLDLGAMVLAADGALLDVTAVDGRSLMQVRFDNEEPLRLTLPSLVADWESSKPQHVEMVFDGLPIDWMSPFMPEVTVHGGAVYGELHAVTGGGKGLTLEPVAPFEIRDLQLAYRGQVIADGSTASLEPRIRFDNTSSRIAMENIRLRTTGRDRLDGELILESARDRSGQVDTSLYLEGEFPSVADRIGKLGALSWRQRAIIHIPDRTLEVTDLEVGLSDAVGTRFLELASTRPFIVAAEPFEVRVEGGSPEILRATVTPLELQQLFPQVLGFQLEGVLPQGEFVGRVEDGGVLLAAEDPLVFRDVSVRWQEAALLDRVTVGLQYQVLYSAEGLQARSIDFATLGPRGAPIAEATLRAVMPLSERSTLESLHFEALANLEPLTRQPIFRGLPAFLEGTIGGSIEMSFGERSSLSGSLALRDARIEDNGVLPDVDASLDVVPVTGERLEVTAPLSLSSDNGISDLRFAGGVVKNGEAVEFEAALTGDRLVVPDVMRFVNLLSSPASEGEPSQNREAVGSDFQERWSKTAIDQVREQRDEAPFWGGGVSGRAILTLATLEFARYAVREIHGELHVDPSQIALREVEASLLGARLTADGGLAFDEAAETPYELQFRSSFEGLDLGALFRAVDPEAPPTLEGVFEVHTVAAGRGRNLADLGLGSLGSVRVAGRDGVFRGLAGQFGLARTGANVIGFLTFSKQLKAISRLLGDLENLEFETFDLELARETPRRFGISELRVVSPLAVIDGRGGVEVEPGIPLALSPLDMTLDMETHGDLTILFDGLGLLGPDENAAGYRPLTRPVTVGGTVSEPDTTAFYEMLDEAAADSKGVVGVAMRKANRKLQKAQAAAQP